MVSTAAPFAMVLGVGMGIRCEGRESDKRSIAAVPASQENKANIEHILRQA